MNANVSNINPATALKKFEKTIATLNTISDEMKAQYIDRDHVITALITALTMQSSIFLLGDPGLAKSDVLKNLGNRITSKNKKVTPFYNRTIDGNTLPEHVWGPLDLLAFKNDQYKHITEGFAASSRVVLNDEIWRGTQMYRNAILEAVLNRRITIGTETLPSLPMTLFCCAANSGPRNDDDAAFYDRLIFRVVVNTIKGADFAEYLTRSANGTLKTPTITTINDQDLDELYQFIANPQNVTVPDEIIQNILTLREELEAKGIQSSIRRWGEIIMALKTVAVLRGSTTVDVADMKILQYVLWEQREEIRDVRKCVLRIAAPTEAVLQEKLEIAFELYTKTVQDAKSSDNENKKTTLILQAIRQLAQLQEDITELQQSNPQGTYTDAAKKLQGFDSHLKGILISL